MLTRFKEYDKIFKLNEIIEPEHVNKAAFNRIRRSFTEIITKYKFFAEILFNLKVMEAYPGSGINTMATDGKSIVYSGDFVANQEQSETVFVLLHEIMHNVNFHFARRINRDPHIWNCAADYAINIQLEDMAKEIGGGYIKAPKGILLDSQYRGMAAEQIYEILVKDPSKLPPPPQGGGQGDDDDDGDGDQDGQGGGQGKPGKQGKGKGKGQPGQGQGQGQGKPGQGVPAGGVPEGDIRKPGSLDGKGEVILEGNPKLQDTKDEGGALEEAWKDIRIDAASKSRGTGSASLDRWLRKATKPKVNWRAELKRFVAQVFDELDYAYFNKRFLSKDMYLPGVKTGDVSTFENVVIAIDTSGSIDDNTLAKFGNEMMSLFKIYSIHKCYVIWCDSQIPKDGVQLFDIADKTFKLDKLKPKGGGGTSFRPPFKWIEDNLLKKNKQPAFVVYFTDAYGDAPSPNEYRIRQYGKRVLWVITDNDEVSHLKFGTKLLIDRKPD